MQLRSEAKRNQHMVGFLTAIETLVQSHHFSIAPSTGENASGQFLSLRNLNGPSPHDSQEIDPIRQVVLRLHCLEQLDKQADKLSLYTNNAYHAVGQA